MSIHYYRHTLTIFIVLLSAGTSLSQKLNFEQITIDEGLANNNVNAIIEDDMGFIWFGTKDGLLRFDGYEHRYFKTYDLDVQFASDNIRSLHEDKDHNIWIGSQKGGVSLYDLKREKIIHRPLLENDQVDWDTLNVSAVFTDSRNNIWISTLGQGLFLVDSYQRVRNYTVEDGLLSMFCFELEEDALGNIWVPTAGSGFSYIRGSNFELKTINADDYGREGQMNGYYKSIISKDGHIYIGAEGKGLFIYTPAKDELSIIGLYDLFVHDLHFHGDDLYIATDGDGLFLHDKLNGGFKQYQYNPHEEGSLNTNAIYNLYTDSNSNLWIGTFNGGVNVYKPSRFAFQHLFQGDLSKGGPGSQSVLSMIKDTSGSLWIGTDGGGLYKGQFTDGKFSAIEQVYNDVLSSNVITSLYIDRKRRFLWVGTYARGLNQIDLQSGEHRSYLFEPDNPNSISNNNIWTIEEDMHGDIWFGTLGGGLTKYLVNEQRFIQSPEKVTSSVALPDRNIRTIQFDEDDNLWIGTDNEGIYKLDFRKRQLIKFPKINKLNIFSILIKEDRVYIGTDGNGMYIFDKSGYFKKHIKLDDLLGLNVIHSIEEVTEGELWLASNAGVICYHVEADSLTVFDSADGVQSNQFNTNSSLKYNDGRLLFGGLYGISSFNVDEILINETQANPVFTDFSVNNQSVRDDSTYLGPDKSINTIEEIQLGYRQNNFSIAFAGLEYTNPDKNQYAYKMEGYDEGWIKGHANRRVVNYTDLPFGNYIFKLKTSNNSGVWSTTERHLNISISPPFWATNWFKFLSFLILLLLVYIAFRIYIGIQTEESSRKLLEAEQEILKLKNQNLEQTVRNKNAELSAALLQTAHKNNTFSDLKEEIRSIFVTDLERDEKRLKLSRLLRKIDTEIKSEDYWMQFQFNFDQVYQDFSNRLSEKHPTLTVNDLRLSSLIKVKLTNREIASILNISIRGVEKAKYRLKKKLELKAEQQLTEYIYNLS